MNVLLAWIVSLASSFGKSLVACTVNFAVASWYVHCAGNSVLLIDLTGNLKKCRCLVQSLFSAKAWASTSKLCWAALLCQWRECEPVSTEWINGPNADVKLQLNCSRKPYLFNIMVCRFSARSHYCTARYFLGRLTVKYSEYAVTESCPNCVRIQCEFDLMTISNIYSTLQFLPRELETSWKSWGWFCEEKQSLRKSRLVE